MDRDKSVVGMKPCQKRVEPSPRNTNARGGSWREQTRKDKNKQEAGTIGK